MQKHFRGLKGTLEAFEAFEALYCARIVFKEEDVTTRAARPETGQSISTRSGLHQTAHDEGKNLVSPI